MDSLDAMARVRLARLIDGQKAKCTRVEAANRLRLERPCAPPEDLRAVPVDETPRRMMFPSDGRVQLAAVMPQKDRVESIGSVCFVRDEYALLAAERERADIEEFVMQAAERDAVFDDIGGFDV
nr:hypothetical protein [Caballeronia sp. Lep1P3]